MHLKRRKFIKQSVASTAGIAAGALLPADLLGRDYSTIPIEEVIVKPVLR